MRNRYRENADRAFIADDSAIQLSGTVKNLTFWSRQGFGIGTLPFLAEPFLKDDRTRINAKKNGRIGRRTKNWQIRF